MVLTFFVIEDIQLAILKSLATPIVFITLNLSMIEFISRCGSSLPVLLKFQGLVAEIKTNYQIVLAATQFKSM